MPMHRQIAQLIQDDRPQGMMCQLVEALTRILDAFGMLIGSERSAHGRRTAAPCCAQRLVYGVGPNRALHIGFAAPPRDPAAGAPYLLHYNHRPLLHRQSANRQSTFPRWLCHLCTAKLASSIRWCQGWRGIDRCRCRRPLLRCRQRQGWWGIYCGRCTATISPLRSSAVLLHIARRLSHTACSASSMGRDRRTIHACTVPPENHTAVANPGVGGTPTATRMAGQTAAHYGTISTTDQGAPP